MTGRRHGVDVPPRRAGGPTRRAGTHRNRGGWTPYAVLVWALGYGGLRVHWALGGAPEFPPLGSDLYPLTGWGTVVPVGAAAVLAVALARANRWHRSLALAGWAGSALLVLLCPLLLLDAVGLVIPGLGLPFDPAGILGRVGALTGGLLLAAAARAYWRRCRDDRPTPGWIGALVTSCAGTDPPRWARIAGYLAVTGCLVRLVAQYAVGMTDVPFPAGPSVIVFEAGFLLAGVLLPLALVHRWGRVFPGWVPVLAGRRVPRWLLLGPGFGLGVGLTVYFGVGTGQLAVETVTGSWDPGDGTYPLWFFWVAMPAYLAWGLGLTAASGAYRWLTAGAGGRASGVDGLAWCR
ncbi:hypothetical protein I0C86_27035 [Plantactinospora sp. S1510]|uniref:DUF3995 domain-containing protein n=1 Tax=Plantactinospora alkalitolerans TaxID=2789879 RepID=A0ABS0H2B0_9ACTN|nr:hypothetical protein [Plantactinospora alkalitolerans]MBF9132580.1 hypothetical protein [Plantactinospora alkalitolerans]